MIGVAVLGAGGRMGRLVVGELAGDPELRLVAAVGRGFGPGCFAGADVVVDFSLPDALRAALPFVEGRALVSGTTGLDPELVAALDAQAERAPVLWSANFSLGVALLRELVSRAARALPEADVEIVEVHHRRKRDAPSGTALLLVDAVASGRGAAAAVRSGRSGLTGERPHGEIGVHALRGGGVVGDHEVSFLLEGERVALSHAAISRATFARGALRAARFVAGKPARRYELADVLGTP